MLDIKQVLKEIGAKNGLEMSLDENGACSLELADGRIMLVQERAGLDELDFVATLGPVPEELRAKVFTELLAANFYWKETFGATISWNADLEELDSLAKVAYKRLCDEFEDAPINEELVEDIEKWLCENGIRYETVQFHFKGPKNVGILTLGTERGA